MKAKVKVTVKTGRKGDAGTLVAKIPVSVVKTKQPQGQLIYRTKAQLNLHSSRG
jgi:hypothetical protein